MYTNKKYLALLLFLLLNTVGCVDRNKIDNEHIYSHTLSIDIKSHDVDSIYGTGLIISTNTVLTVAHLIPDDLGVGDSISLETDKSKANEAIILKIDQNRDLILLNYNVDTTPVNLLISNQKPVYSDKIKFFGNTNGFGLVYREGYIAKNQTKFIYNKNERNIFFISNSVNGGESGSPLFNENLELIGIVSFKLNNSYGQPINDFSGAIPSDEIMDFLYN